MQYPNFKVLKVDIAGELDISPLSGSTSESAGRLSDCLANIERFELVNCYNKTPALLKAVMDATKRMNGLHKRAKVAVKHCYYAERASSWSLYRNICLNMKIN